MTARTSIRIACALALGALFDLVALRNAFPYTDRDWLGEHAGMPSFWHMLALLVACTFALSLTARAPGPRAVHPSSSVPSGTLDRIGLLMPLVILLGLTLAHTAVVIHDTIVDPTSHNLLPFEFLISWVVVGLPALFGSIAGRAASWTTSRFHMHRPHGLAI